MQFFFFFFLYLILSCVACYNGNSFLCLEEYTKKKVLDRDQIGDFDFFNVKIQCYCNYWGT